MEKSKKKTIPSLAKKADKVLSRKGSRARNTIVLGLILLSIGGILEYVEHFLGFETESTNWLVILGVLSVTFGIGNYLGGG